LETNLKNIEEVKEKLKNIIILEYHPHSVADETEGTDGKKKEEKNETDGKSFDDDKIISKIFDVLSSHTSENNFQWFKFNKDEETHLQFILSVSNIRAISYGIGEANKNKVRTVAGLIIPAMASTTVFVSGLSCVEQAICLLGANKNEQFFFFLYYYY
jgi:ubiquitin-activating enzyme E1